MLGTRRIVEGFEERREWEKVMEKNSGDGPHVSRGFRRKFTRKSKVKAKAGQW